MNHTKNLMNKKSFRITFYISVPNSRVLGPIINFYFKNNFALKKLFLHMKNVILFFLLNSVIFPQATILLVNICSYRKKNMLFTMVKSEF